MQFMLLGGSDLGAIQQKGDLTKIKKTSSEVISSLNEHGGEYYAPGNTPLRFHLNTPGGDIEEAMKIGKFARDILVEIDSYGTIIIAPGSEEEKYLNARKDPWKDRDYIILPPDDPLTEKHIVRNYSAGIIIFYGAATRAHRDNSDQRLGFYKKIPVIGIHRPYYVGEYFSNLSSAKAEQAYKILESSVRSYLSEMGAPQALIDRMFNNASNDIELLTAEEFRGYYKSEESFLQEWLIAKCGDTGHYQNILKDDEAKDFTQMEWEQAKSRVADKAKADKPVFYLYQSERFPQKYVENLYNKVRNHNFSVNSCQEKAVSLHQREWSKKYRE
jgi:hypothetical protein